MFSALPIPGWIDLIDIAMIAGFGWLAIRYVRTTRARPALLGLGVLTVVYFIARGLELRLTASLLQGFFAVVVLILVVVFQEDLRRVFEQLGTWRRGRPEISAESATLDQLVRSMSHLAATNTGALVIVSGQDPLDRHLEGGIPLFGRMSEPLLLSLFDKHSPGHDGAALLRGSVIERFALHLPLSANHSEIGPGGTRHAAALGLAERCDATCIVVSEERGTISVARDGQIRTLARVEDLVGELQSLYQTSPQSQAWWRGRVGLDAAIAGIGALVLWMVLVPGSDVSEKRVSARVEIANLPKEWVLQSVEPPSVEVVLHGLRRDLLLADPDRVSVSIDAYLARMGRRSYSVSADDVQKPSALSVVSVEPDRVKISLENVEKKELK